MICWLQRKRLHPLRLRAVLTLTDNPGFIRSLCEHTCPSLISMSDADLESVIIEPGPKRPSVPVIFIS
jgi:hypothetical protein